MSIVSLPTDIGSSISIDTFREILHKYKINIKSEDDERTYLLLLQSADAIVSTVNDMPDYIDPRLRPQQVMSERKYWVQNSDTLNAWSHRCDFIAANPTSAALKGRTIAVKDNISVAGLPTTVGTFQQLHLQSGFRISEIDATVVARVLSAGGRLLGTATCENYSACPLSYSSASGPVHNPRRLGYTTGGSSSGCAALLAANADGALSLDPEYSKGLPQLAIGGDQGGSIRLPASYTGIFGLKPTHGLVPYTGVAPLHSLLDHVGPMATNIKDIALLLSVIAGYDGLDTRMTPESPLRENVKDYLGLLESFLNRDLEAGEKLGSGLKVGIITESLEVIGLDSGVRDRIHSAAMRAFPEVGTAVREVSIPMHRDGPSIWTAATRFSMAQYGMRGEPAPTGYPLPHVALRWPPDQEMYDLLTATNPAAMNLAFAEAYLNDRYGTAVKAKAQHHVYELRAAYDEALKDYDVLVAPVTPTVAMPHPTPESSVMEKIKLAVGSTSNTCPFNATGHPAISVPCGLLPAGDGKGSLPIGIQLIGRRFDEETLLKAAAVFEIGFQELDW